MASLENLDEEALRAKLEEATSYEERAAIRQALRSLKKGRGEQVGGSKGARRGASCYNRFAGGSRSGPASKTPQSFVPAGSKSPSVTPLRSTTPTSRSQRIPTPTSPSSTTSPGPDEDEIRRQKQREIEERNRRREEERKEREREEERKRRREEEKRARELQMEEERKLQKEQEEQELERQREEEERQLQRERERLGEEVEEQQLLKEQEEEEREHQKEELQETDGQAGDEDSEEGPKSPPSTPVEKEHEKEWIMVDKNHAQKLEKEAAVLLDQDQTDGPGPSFGVPLRSTHPAKGMASHEAPEPKAEFQKFQLRKTQSSAAEKSSSESTSSSVSNFGVRLKPTSSANSQRGRAQTYVTSAGHKSASTFSPRRGAAPTTTNFPHSSGKTQGNVPRDSSSQSGLVAYVNAALQLHPPLSPSSSALYETCSNPSLLCKLINKSVPNTVDLRALTRTPPPSQAASREEAMQENMTLVVESARAIGCRIDDDSGQRILDKDPETIRKFLLDLIRARVVNLPGMDEEPPSTFENVTLMLEKLGIVCGGGEDTDQPQDWYVPKERVSPCPGSDSAQEKATTIDHSPASHTSVASTGPDKPSLDADLTYEERAARRRAERERRRKEREALATAK